MTGSYLKSLFPLVDALAETLGKNCEVVLHDFMDPDHSIVKIANGHVTGRDVGAPATGFVLPFIGKSGPPDAVVGYRTRSKGGAELKSTTVLLKDARGRVIGALCINMDITSFVSVQRVLEQFCFTSNLGPEPGRQEGAEKFESNVDSLFQDLLNEALNTIGKPLAYMGREDRLQLLRDLKGRGLFMIKGAARRLSRELNLSLATIYKNLEEIE